MRVVESARWTKARVDASAEALLRHEDARSSSTTSGASWRTATSSAQSVVLGSRAHYCVNKKVKKSGNVNEECKRLMDVSAGGDARGCFCSGGGE